MATKFNASEYEKAKALLRDLSSPTATSSSSSSFPGEKKENDKTNREKRNTKSKRGEAKGKGARATPRSMLSAHQEIESPDTSQVDETPSEVTYVNTQPEFIMKLSEIEKELLELLNKFGIRFSVEAKLKRMLGELSSLFNESVGSLREQLQDLHRLRTHYEDKQDDQETSHLALVKKMRQEEASRVRKLKAQHQKSHKSEMRRIREEMKAKHKEEMKESATVKRYNELQVKDIENRIREKVADEARNKRLQEVPNDQILQDKIKRLEEKAVESLRAKENELRHCKEDLEYAREQIAERKEIHKRMEGAINQHKSKVHRLLAENETLQVKQVEMQTTIESQSCLAEQLQQKLRGTERHMHEERSQLLSQCQEQVISSSKLETELRDQIKNLYSKLDRRKEEYRNALANETERMRRDLDGAKRALNEAKCHHSSELDNINARVRQLVEKKNEQMKALQLKLSGTQKKLIQTERFLKKLENGDI